jgi:hypothetical protein
MEPKMVKSERKLGVIPEWAKTGPISAKNYHYRAELHCATKSAQRSGEHPTINLESPDILIWQEYFDRWLSGRPRAFELLLDATIREMTVPEPIPQWFDPSFVPTKGWKPAPVEGRTYGADDLARLLRHDAAGEAA